MSNPINLNAVQESQLFTSSLATDVQVSQGYLKIGQMSRAKLSLISDMVQVKYKAETVQIVTVTTSSITPAGNTYYTIEFGDTNRSRGGVQEQLKRVSYLTPADITTLGATAALQREAINVQLIASINEWTDTYYVTAATSGSGNGFTITDSSGYYPVNAQGMTNRLGATYVKTCRNSDGSGFVGTEASITTAAVYSFGIGADLAAWKPVLDQMWGNLISGYLGGTAPKTAAGAYATSGQKYDGFAVVSLTESPIATPVRTQTAYMPKIQIAYVDNGTGSDTGNATGFAAFENSWLNVQFGQYKDDPSAIIFMNNNIPTCGGLNTGLPDGTSLAENVINFGNGNATHYFPLGTNTIVALTATTDGIGVVLDATNGEGVELSAPTFTNSQKNFVVGKTAASVYCKIKVDDASGVNPMLVGFRKQAAANATYTAYSDFAFIGIIGTANPNTIYTATENDGGGNTNVDTTMTWADNATKTLQVNVDLAGAVTFFVDGYAPTVTQAFSFDIGDTLIPVFCYALQSADLGTPFVSQGAFLQTTDWRQ